MDIEIIIVLLQIGMIFLIFWGKEWIRSSIQHDFDIKLETFKQTFEGELFARERKDKFQLACLDERLKAHQEAFNLSYEFMQKLYLDDVSEKAKLAEQYKNFYATRSLYLTSKAQNALYNAAFAFGVHEQYLRMARIEGGDENWKIVKENFEKMRTAPSIIASEIDLEAKAEEWPFPGKEPSAFGDATNDEHSR